MSKILVSIISVTYNTKNDIRSTFSSVLNFLDHEVEYIIVDGGSTDGTLEEIVHISDKLSFWVSEPDKGIYDAMNKGIKKAQGEFLYFVNAGDILQTIPKEILRNNVDDDIICFPVQLSSVEIVYPQLNWTIKIKNTIPHQGCFYRNNNIHYDIAYKVFADFSLNQLLYKTGKSINILNKPIIATHDITGVSHEKKHLKEIFQVVEDNFGWQYKCLSEIYFKYLGLKNKLATLNLYISSKF